MEEKGFLHKGACICLVAGVLFIGCGGGSTPPPQSDTHSALQQEGDTVTVDNQSGTPSNALGKNDTAADQNATLPTNAPAQDVTASQEALFVAEGDRGVEVISIGYKDRIDHELLTTITGINATFVALSEDQTRLYVQNREGYVNIYNISDLKNPVKERIIDKKSLHIDPTTKNGLYEFVAKQEKGMVIYDIGNPSDRKVAAKFTQRPVYDILLIDDDTKALTATKTMGVDLLDISDPTQIHRLGNHPLPGETLGLSINEKSGLLFVANGDNGVQVFNLNIFIDDFY